MNPIHFRAHHFLCALCFQGKGYSPGFIKNFQAIMHRLKSKEGDDQPIQIVDRTDDICSPCPNRRHEICVDEEKIGVLDRAHANALQLKTNEILTWGEAKKRIADHLTLDVFHDICATCGWKPYGICENVLKDFLNK